MKNLLTFFIKYPVSTNIFILAFVIFGYMGAKQLRSSFFPLSDSKMIQIQVVYPGASPEEMEEGVVLKIEDNLKGIVGVDRVTSVSRENSAIINVEIEMDKDVDVVLADVKNAVDRVPSFPVGMEPPIISKIEVTRETISFSVSGKNMSLKTLKQYARDIENDLRGMKGISQVELSGFPDEEIEIALRESDLRGYNLTFTEVANAVRKSNILMTGGNIKTSEEDYLIRASNRVYYGEEMDNIVVRTNPDGTIIHLKDIATIKDTWSEVPDRLYFNGDKAINITVKNTKSEDLIGSARKIKAYIKKFNKQHDNVQLTVSTDSSITLEQRTQLLAKNGMYGVLLVLLFLALFLNTKLAFWVAAGMPIAFFGMFAVVAYMGVTINVLSLFGMIIVIGVLVDDGIVIGENIYHHFEKGKGPIEAAVDGAMEVSAAVFSAVLTTMIAFSTFYFLDGRIGTFFGEVATVVLLTLGISMVEAFLILPAHIAHSGALVRKDVKQNAINTFFSKINKFSEKGLFAFRDKVYGPSLRFFLKYKVLGLAIPLALLIFSFMGGIKGGLVKTAFFPSVASDRITVNLDMPQGTNEAITDSILRYIETQVWEVGKEYTKKQSGHLPVVDNTIRRIGPGSAKGSLKINLLPGERRDFPSSEITKAIRERVGEVAGVESLTFGSGAHIGGAPIAVSLLGHNIKELKAATEELKSKMHQMPALKDITDTDPEGIKEVKIKLKDNAYLLGLTLQSVMAQVRAGFFGAEVQRFQRGQDEIKVWVRYVAKDRSSIQDLDRMWIVTPKGSRVPFSEIATYAIERGQVAINHLDSKREIQVVADLISIHESSTELMDEIKTDIIPGLMSKYHSVSVLYEGQNREASKTKDSAQRVGLAVLVMIYLIIAFTFRSYSQPLLLMLLIPFSLIGVIWGHYIHGFKVNLLSWLGIIALIGIQVNDGLVLIEKFNGYLKEGRKYDDALYLAGMSRFRAIFLTTITTFAGLFPLLMERSRQAQFLKPMAASISYGIIVSTVLTLVMLPVLLSMVNYVKVFIKWLFTGRDITREEVERAIIELKHENDE
ncbi:MAG TPA: efflux RND transporter permease subunit [Saprospiraceae bacterium]|nr:efflux RND transporter permease subunit [Saprospiraceae bacterium]